MKRTFDELIGGSSNAGGSKSVHFSGGTIKDAVLMLMSHHQNKDALLQEVDDLSGEPKKLQKMKNGVKELRPLDIQSVQGFIRMLEIEACGRDLPTTAALECAKKLKSLSEQKIDETKQTAMIRVVVEAIKILKEDNKFNEGIFIHQLCSTGGAVNAELLWILNKEFIMTIDAYISCNLGTAVIFEALPGNITSMCRSVSESDDRKMDIIADLMAYLVRQGYAQRSSELDPATKKLKKVTVAILDSILKDILKNISNLSLPHQNPFYLAFNHGGLDAEVIKRCCTHLLAVTMSLNPDLKVSQALLKQATWKYANTPPSLTQFYKHLMLVFDAKEVLNIIRRVLARQEVNWETVLSFAATFLVLFRDASDVYRGLVKSLLQEAFESLEVEHLIMAFLLARQGCLEGPHVFPTYQEWYQDSFGSNTSPANNKKAFSLLMKFLNDIVPFETPNSLRVHVLKSPNIPAKCNAMYAEYVMLAKMRLSDMNEPLDPQVGIYTNTKSDNTELEDQINNDVNSALASFEQTHKVPTIIIEASIFRKPYYIKRFLPALMKTRPLPDELDSRMKFIAAINQSGKIPSAMLIDYETKCKQMTEQLLEGVFADDEDVMLLEPEEQLKVMLNQFLEATSKELDKKGKETDVSSKLSLINARVDEILGKESKKGCADLNPVVIGEGQFTSPKICLVCEMLLNTYCRLAALLSTAGHIKDSWHKPYVEIMVSHPGICSYLFDRVWNIVISEDTSLDQHHVLGLAHLLAVLATFSKKVPNVVTPSKHSAPLHEAVLLALPYHNKEWMVFSFRFITYYLQYSHCQVRLSTKAHKSLYQKFQILAYRHCPNYFNFTPMEPSTLPVLEEQQLAIEIMKSDNYQVFSNGTGKFSFEDWIALECSVIPECDLLSEPDRQAFYDWLFHTQFLPRPASEGGCDGSYRDACMTTFKEIIRFWMKPKLMEDRCNNHKVEEGSGSCHHIVRLLQNLCLQTSMTTKSKCAIPWVIEVSEQSILEFTQMVVPVCYRLYSQLPPQLFWTDDIRVTPSEQMVKNSCRHIQQDLRNHVSDGLCLTYPCLLFLLRGALSFKSVEIEKLVCGTSKENLYISLAILIHWNKLKWLQNCFNSPDLHGLEKVKSQVYRQMFVAEPAMKMKMTTPSMPYACYSILRESEKDLTPMQIQKALMLFSGAPGIIDSIIQTAMCDISLQESQETQWFNILEGLHLLVCSNPRYLIEFANTLSDSLPHVPDLSGRLRCVSFLRMMTKTPDNELSALLKEDNTMKSLLDIYTNVGKLYDTQSGESSLSYYQPLTADLITSFSKFLKKCLHLCPKDKIAVIPNMRKLIATLSSTFTKEEAIDCS